MFTKNFEFIRKIKTFSNNNVDDSFNGPTGIFVDNEGVIYVADSQNNRVVVLNKNDEVIKIVKVSKSELLGNDFVFIPQKIVVDAAKRIYVLAKNVFEGIIQFSSEGVFIGYVGSNKVITSPVDLFWKSIMTSEQKKSLISFIPVEYTNISLDNLGFIFAVTSVKNVEAPIRRLNPSGEDILIRNPLNESKMVAGDVLYSQDINKRVYGPSSFVDITQDNKGNYFALDGKRGRIFAYDEDGNMLYVFGGLKTDQKGTFYQPSALVYVDDKIYVLDRDKATVNEFTPTEYATLITKAMNAYYLQNYEESIQLWMDVLKKNSNFDLAYVKLGYAFYRMKKYPQAMENFKIANAKEAYSKASVKNRREVMNKRFELYVLGALFIILLIILTYFFIKKMIIKKRNIKKQYLKS